MYFSDIKLYTYILIGICITSSVCEYYSFTDCCQTKCVPNHKNMF